MSNIAQSAGTVEYTDPPTHTNECTRYDTKQSDVEVPAVLDLWGMQSTPSLPLLPGPLWPGVIAPDRRCFQDLFKMACSIIVSFPSSFFSKHFIE